MSTSNINPYALPQSDLPLDFREAAVEESLRLVSMASGRPVEDLGVSLVLPVAPSRRDTLQWMGWMTLLRLVLGIGGVVAGGVLAWASRTLMERGLPEWQIMSIAAFCSIGGILLLFNWFFIRAGVRRALGERYARVQQFSTSRSPLCTGVEDARTFVQMKLLPEDLVWIAFDSASKRLIMEGLLFRYVIHAADVLFVGEVSGTTATGVQVTFRVGNIVIAITMQMESIWYELRRQTWGRPENPLLRPIRAALEGK